MPRSFHYIVKGRVQGVFFRAFANKAAKELGVVGFVQNDATGTVSGVAQGDKSELETFKTEISKGPRHALVTEVSITDEKEVDRYEFPDFEIRYPSA